MNRTLRLHAFCSVKGGVGKSTLAVTGASWLAQQGRTVVLLDADLTGNSLADGLSLSAPVVALRQDGTMDLLAAPTGRYLSPKETESLRDKRQWQKRGDSLSAPPPFLNDALTFRGNDTSQDCRLDAMFWRHSEHVGLLVLPSSPLRYDVAVAVGWLYRKEQHEWMRRLSWVLYTLAEQLPAATDVVIDLPPGLFGFGHAVLLLLALLSDPAPLPEGYPSFAEIGVNIKANPFLVTTPDRNALVVSLEHYLRLRPQLASLELLVNRAYEGMSAVLDELKARFGPHLTALEISSNLRSVDENQTLNRLFRRGGLDPAAAMDSLARTLRLDVPS